MTNLVSFMGAPGVGKSYLIDKVQEKEGIFFYDRDLVMDGIFGDDRESDHYRRWTGPLTKSTWQLAMANARSGASTILESPMTGCIQGKPAGFIDDALKDAQEHDYKVSLIYCVAPENVIKERLISRGLPRDHPKYEAWQKFVDTFVDVPGPEYYHLIIDTTDNPQENLKAISDFLRR